MSVEEIAGLYLIGVFLCAVVAFARALAMPAALSHGVHMNTKPAPRKQSSSAVSRLAAKCLRPGYRATAAEVRTLAASVLAQDETPPPKPARAAKSPAKGAQSTGKR